MLDVKKIRLFKYLWPGRVSILTFSYFLNLQQPYHFRIKYKIVNSYQAFTFTYITVERSSLAENLILNKLVYLFCKKQE